MLHISHAIKHPCYEEYHGDCLLPWLPHLFIPSPQLRGKQGFLCSARFSPSSGTLAAHEKLDITVSFTAHTDASIPCQREPLDPQCLNLQNIHH